MSEFHNYLLMFEKHMIKHIFALTIRRYAQFKKHRQRSLCNHSLSSSSASFSSLLDLPHPGPEKYYFPPHSHPLSLDCVIDWWSRSVGVHWNSDKKILRLFVGTFNADFAKHHSTLVGGSVDIAQPPLYLYLKFACKISQIEKNMLLGESDKIVW